MRTGVSHRYARLDREAWAGKKPTHIEGRAGHPNWRRGWPRRTSLQKRREEGRGVQTMRR